jgi:hypothetical protein
LVQPATQVNELGSQRGVVPVHAVIVVAEHCTQCPVTHAGAAADGQGTVDPEPRSPSHSSQTPALVLQTGAEPGHSALDWHPH